MRGEDAEAHAEKEGGKAAGVDTKEGGREVEVAAAALRAFEAPRLSAPLPPPPAPAPTAFPYGARTRGRGRGRGRGRDRVRPKALGGRGRS